MIDLRELARYENGDEEVEIVCIDGQSVIGMPGEVDDEEDSGLGEPGITVYLPDGGAMGIGISEISSISIVNQPELAVI